VSTINKTSIINKQTNNNNHHQKKRTASILRKEGLELVEVSLDLPLEEINLVQEEHHTHLLQLVRVDDR
jgi:hypothetical protein